MPRKPTPETGLRSHTEALTEALWQFISDDIQPSRPVLQVALNVIDPEICLTPTRREAVIEHLLTAETLKTRRPKKAIAVAAAAALAAAGQPASTL